MSADDDLSRRLKSLDSRLEAKRPAAPPSLSGSEPAPADPSALGRAFRLSTEFVAGVIAGGGLGWGADRLFGIKPWGMIVLLMLGFAAGIYNVMRASGFLTSASAKETPPRKD